jgi:SAM-dependent methyltransferase
VSEERSSILRFEGTAVHEEAREAPSEVERLRATLALVPAEARSLLEVGCGRGDLVNRASTPFAVGTDLARRALRYVEKPVLASSIFTLPFRDGTFDVVLCAETLEHLDPARVADAARELRRVARRWVVVTVPYDENLLEWSHRCPACGGVSHLHGHLRSFRPEDLRALFPGASQYEIRGVWPMRAWSWPLLRFRTRRLNLWKYTRHARCPHCGNDRFPNHETRRLYRLVGSVNSLLHPRKTCHRWLLMRATY